MEKENQESFPSYRVITLAEGIKVKGFYLTHSAAIKVLQGPDSIFRVKNESIIVEEIFGEDASKRELEAINIGRKTWGKPEWTPSKVNKLLTS